MIDKKPRESIATVRNKLLEQIELNKCLITDNVSLKEANKVLTKQLFTYMTDNSRLKLLLEKLTSNKKQGILSFIFKKIRRKDGSTNIT